MHHSLINYIHERSQSELSNEDIQLIKEAFIPKKLRKKEFLLQTGEICKYIGFIVSGATKQYTIDDKGNEHVMNLAIEHWWTSDRESFYNQTPSIYAIDAWEETELLLLPFGYYTRVNHIPAFKEMRVKLDDNNYTSNQRRMNHILNMKAEQRYEELVRAYPEFLHRFPQHILASYLGITKETLSRIRNQTKG
nr:Crp/Fnr family transcriptional regulator [uncultured Fluviicola sp.]